MAIEENVLKKIDDTLDYRARTIVGTLLKKLEVLQKEQSFSEELYRALIKEEIYQQFRELKEFIHIYLTLDRIEFKSPKKD